MGGEEGLIYTGMMRIEGEEGVWAVGIPLNIKVSDLVPRISTQDAQASHSHPMKTTRRGLSEGSTSLQRIPPAYVRATLVSADPTFIASEHTLATLGPTLTLSIMSHNLIDPSPDAVTS